MHIETLTVGSLATNCYLVREGNDAVIIDPGDEADRLLAVLGERTLHAILLTHGHADHIGAADRLREATGVPLYVHADDAAMITDREQNLSFMIGAFALAPADQLLSAGQRLRFGGIDLAVVHTPGHTPGGVCFDDGHEHLFAGDTLFLESVGRADFPGGSMAVLQKSIREKIFPLGDRTVYPGHGPITSLAHERECNMFL